MGKCEEMLAEFAATLAIYANDLQEYRRTKSDIALDASRVRWREADGLRSKLEAYGCVSGDVSTKLYAILQAF